MGIRDRPASAIPVSPFPVSLLPLSLRSLLGPELVLFPLVELIVEVVVVVFVEILIVELVFIQIIIEVFVEFLVLFEFSELLVDVVAPALERPVRRRLAGQHCPPPGEVYVERPNSGTRSLLLLLRQRPLLAAGQLAAVARAPETPSQPPRRPRHLHQLLLFHVL